MRRPAQRSSKSRISAPFLPCTRRRGAALAAHTVSASTIEGCRIVGLGMVVPLEARGMRSLMVAFGLIALALNTAVRPIGTAAAQDGDPACVDHAGPCAAFAEAVVTAVLIRDRSLYPEVLGEIAVVQADSGLIAEARKTFAEAIAVAQSLTDDWARIDILSRIARFQIAAGLLDDARDTAGLIIGADHAFWLNVPGFMRSTVSDVAMFRENAFSVTLSDIAVAEASAGRFADAMATADTVLDGQSRAHLLAYIAEAQVRAGRLAEAGAVAAAILDVPPRVRTLHAIADAHATQGRMEDTHQLLTEAAHLAGTMREPLDRAGMLIETAQALAAADATEPARQIFDQALTAADEIQERLDLRDQIVGDVALAQAQAGMFADAQGSIARIPDQSVYGTARRDLLIQFAVIQAAAGHTAEARQTFDQVLTAGHAIPLPIDRYATARDVAYAQIEAGLFTDALATAAALPADDSAPSVLEQAQLRADIARAQTDGGLLAEARATIGTIALAPQRSAELTRLARTQTATGSVDDALQSLTDAADAARTIADAEMRMRALIDLSDAQLAAGRTADARRSLADAQVAAGAMPAPADRASALAVVAGELARAGVEAETRETFAAARTAAGAVAGDEDRFFALLTIGVAEAETGLADDARQTLAEALEVARGQTDSAARARSLAALARHQAFAGLLDAAVTAARPLLDDDALAAYQQERAHALAAIAVARAEAAAADLHQR